MAALQRRGEAMGCEEGFWGGKEGSEIGSQ